MRINSRWPHFTEQELACPHCNELNMDPEFMGRLVNMRLSLGFAFPITSGYRCPEHNARVSSTGLDGPHTTGRAVDIALRGEQALIVVESARRFGFSGIGVRQHGDGRYVHLDDLFDAPGRPRPWLWSYK